MGIEATSSMFPGATPLPTGPTTLVPGPFPERLTVITSGQSGNRHPGYFLYHLWRGARRRLLPSRTLVAKWGFHQDGRQQGDAIPP